MPRLKGIARTRRQRKDGSLVEYHFAWRGGPCIWKTGDRHKVGDREYEAAYHRAHGREPEKAPVPARDIGHFCEVIRAFLTSDDYRGYSDAHKRDLEIWIPRVETEFGDTVIVAFNDPRVKRVAETWRRGWRRARPTRRSSRSHGWSASPSRTRTFVLSTTTSGR